MQPINDESLLAFLSARRKAFPNGVPRSLIEDQDQTQPGALWRHFEDMARRDLVRIADEYVEAVTPSSSNPGPEATLQRPAPRARRR